MGSSASKTARTAGSAARKYPSRPSGAPSSVPNATNAPRQPPPPASSSARPGPTVKPRVHASAERDEAINLDASDPDFARSLRRLGAVQPNPTHSPSSTFPTSNNARPTSASPYPFGLDPRKNPALMVLESRARIQNDADTEFLEAGKRDFPGRRYLDVGIIRQILLMRGRGMSPAQIEKQLELKKGVVTKLGPEGVVGIVET